MKTIISNFVKEILPAFEIRLTLQQKVQDMSRNTPFDELWYYSNQNEKIEVCLLDNQHQTVIN